MGPEFITVRSNATAAVATLLLSAEHMKDAMRIALTLIEYGARTAPGRGVSVNVLKGRKMIAGAFIATMPTGKKIVAMRASNARHKKVVKSGKVRWHALPIRQLYGPSVADGAANKAVQQALFDLYEEKFDKLLMHEYKRLSSKAAKAAMKELR